MHDPLQFHAPVPARRGVRRRAVIESVVCAAFGRRVRELRADSRQGATTAFARQCAMYLSHVVLGLNYSECGRAFGRDRTTAAHACRVIEERRDDTRMDAVIAALEAECRTKLERPVRR